MKLLSIDTSSNICAVAILENETLLKEISQNNGFTHSENLMPMIQELFSALNLTLNDIDLIVCDKGPGSFTGIRIGVASVKALAEVNNLKIADVSALESLSQNIEGEYDLKVSLIDARNNQCYCGIFDSKNDLVDDYMADDINIILDKIGKIIKLKDNKIAFVGNGSTLHKDLILEKIPNAEFSNNNEQTAYSCGMIGLKKYQENKLENADTILPKYLRKSQAERLKKDN